MESSSENSFTWTDTSRDSIESHSMAVAVEDGDGEAKSVRHNKKNKLHKDVNNVNYDKEENEQHDVKPEVEMNNHETQTTKSFKKKIVKQEPESDSDVKVKKNKIKSFEMNGDDNELHSSPSYDETFLNFKVKQEEISEKKKRKKSSVDVDDSLKLDKLKQTDSDSREESTCQLNEYEAEKSKMKKKKKKSKKEKNDSVCEEKMSIDEATDTEEPSINMLDKTKSKASISIVGDSSHLGNHSYQDESSCGEISAIQGDNDHNLDTFIEPKTVEKENKNDNLYKSTIRNQFKIGFKDDQNSPTANNQKRTVRISDRIRFEDESDLEVTPSIHTPEPREDYISYKLRKFMKSNSNLRVVSQTLQDNSILTHDDDVWIVKCPKGIDVQAFCDINLNIQSKSKCKIGGQTYDCSLEENQCEKTAALTINSSQYEVDNFPLCGIINLRKRIPKAHFRDDNIMANNQTNFIPLPETKCRHPLFGSNYKKVIKIPAAIAERLNPMSIEAEEVTVEKRKKKKHKRDRSIQLDDADAKLEETILKSEPEPTIQVSEKKKKRKHAEDDDPAPKRSKKMKYNPESAEAWESEKAIEENLFNF